MSVMPDGSTGPGSPFAQAPNATLNIDGMAIDCAGNIYGAVIGTGNIITLSPAGAQVGALVSVSTAVVTNIAFGGQDHKTSLRHHPGKQRQPGLFTVPGWIPGMPY